MVKKLIILGALALPLVARAVDQTDRLKSFLSLYCRTYESKDIDKFAAFFTPDATENNTSFQDMLPKYRINIEMIESFNYRIDLVDYSLKTDTGNIRVQGKYFTRFLYEGTLKESSGDISMDLIKRGESYLVKRLNYTSGFEKKGDKQLQWGPWIETGNKEIIFKVQVLSSENPLESNSPRFKGLKNIWVYKEDDLYKYTIGNKRDIQSASELQSELHKKGFSDAFVVAFHNGKRIPVREALRLLN
jgi:hypothetical protein